MHTIQFGRTLSLELFMRRASVTHNETSYGSADAQGYKLELIRNLFFCWRLLGLIPGGAPFSQLKRGVKDAMVESTKLVECQFRTKTCKKAEIQNTQKERRNRKTIHRLDQDCKRRLG